MRPSGWLLAATAAGAVVLAACGNEVTVLSDSTGGEHCNPGIAQHCYGPGQCPGMQVCVPDGTAWSTCYCGSGASGNTGGYGATGNSGGWGATGNWGGYGATGNWGGYGAYGNAGGSGATGNWGGHGAYGNAGGWGASGNWGGYGGSGNAGGCGSGTCPLGLVAWWPADGSMMDASGFGNHGSFVSLGGGVEFAQGHDALSFLFHQQGWIEVASTSVLNPTSAITLAAWIRLDQVVGADILGKEDECGNRQYLLSVGNTSLHFRAHIGTSSGFNWFDGDTPALPNVWTHVAMTYDSGSRDLLLYVNGVQDGQQYIGYGGSWIVPMSAPVRIGGGTTCSVEHYLFPGRIDEARIYDRALSAGEVASLASQ